MEAGAKAKRKRGAKRAGGKGGGVPVIYARISDRERQQL